MTINITLPATVGQFDTKPRITVIGVGGAGGNAVNNMIDMGLEGVEFIVANSDAQALAHSRAPCRIQMGTEVTRGLGAGSNPDIGRAAAEDSIEEILSHMRESNMVFITAGLGGGTGTGAAPVIARAARDYGILTVGVVTKPFQFEGARRMKLAERGLEELAQYVDTLLIIPNQNLFRVANESTTFAQAFKLADDVLHSGVRGVTDLMVMPGLINLDFADIRAIMSEMGKAMMGTGEAEGENRAVEAAEAAIANPLLDDSSMSGAKGVLINITAGKDITLFEVDEAANRIRKEVADDANIIFGSTFDDTLQGKVRVSVVATGIESGAMLRRDPSERANDDERRPQPRLEAQPPAPRLVAPLTAISSQPAAAAPAYVPPPPSPMEEVAVARQPEPVQEPMPLQATGTTGFAATRAILPKGMPLSEIRHPVASAAFARAPEPRFEPAVSAPAVQAVPQRVEPSIEPEAEPSSRDLFIPEPPSDGSVASEAPRRVNPFAAADMVNAARQPERPQLSGKPKLGLFERVTGIRRAEPKAAAVQPPHVSEPVISTRPLAAVTGVEAAKPAISESKPATITEGSSQPSPLLGGLDPEDRLVASQEADDPLDIPAFLRRQAN